MRKTQVVAISLITVVLILGACGPTTTPTTMMTTPPTPPTTTTTTSPTTTVAATPPATTIIAIQKVDIIIVVEYSGEWRGELKNGSSIIASGWRTVTFNNIIPPIEYTAEKTDSNEYNAQKTSGGSDPLVLKIIYNGEIVAQAIAGGNVDQAHVLWEGP